jgi:hypothetical protein
MCAMTQIRKPSKNRYSLIMHQLTPDETLKT